MTLIILLVGTISINRPTDGRYGSHGGTPVPGQAAEVIRGHGRNNRSSYLEYLTKAFEHFPKTRFPQEGSGLAPPESKCQCQEHQKVRGA